jgi:hypothetical protein
VRHVDSSDFGLNLIVASENVSVCSVRLFLPICLAGKLHAVIVVTSRNTATSASFSLRRIEGSE